MSLLRRIRRLSRTQSRLLLEAGVLLTASTLGLRLLGYRRTRDRLDRLTPGAAHVPPADLAWAVNAVAGRLPFRPTCLPRALALHSMLERRGVEAEVRIGVRRETDAISGHAWVEVDGKRLGDAPGAEGRHRALLPSLVRSTSARSS